MLIRIYEKKPKRIRVSNAELKVRKSKAVKMRENGASVLEVAKELNVTKSKAKYYCRGCNSTYFKLENRFWRKVNKNPDYDGSIGWFDCWGWNSGMRGGYGSMSVGRSHISGHRYSYELHIGEIKKDEGVFHHCDNPPCCNPDHLFSGPMIDNCIDMAKKLRGTNKLEKHQVLIIYENKDNEIQSVLAKRFGITREVISKIQTGANWGWLTGQPKLIRKPRSNRGIRKGLRASDPF